MTHFMLRTVLAGTVASSLWIPAFSQDKPALAASAASAVTTEMTAGEVRKIDLENKKITLRHGFIKAMNMPPMTMVFVVKEPTQLEKIKAGDKVQFLAEKIDGAFVVTAIEPAP